jgi:hypothetical protein
MSSSAQGVGNFTETENEEITSYFDLYRRLTYEKSVRRGTSLVVKSVSSVDNSNGPYKFDIPAQSNCYISLDQSRLHMRMKLVKANGEALSQSESEAITPVNNILHSIWDSITVGINDVDHVHLAQSRVGYKEVVENLLSYSEEGAAKQLSTQGWCHDKAEDMGTLISTTGTGTNTTRTLNKAKKSTQTKSKWFALSKEHSFVGTVPVDLFCAERCWPPGHKLSLTFHRVARDNFAFITASDALKDCKFVITDLFLTIRYMTMSSDMIAAHQRLWNADQGIIIPFKKTIVRTHTFAKGQSRLEMHVAAQGLLPKSTIVGIVADDAFNGSATTNPYHFKHCDLQRLTVKYVGEQYPYSGGLFTDFSDDKPDFWNAYRLVIDNCGYANAPISPMITPEMFHKGYTLFPVDFSPDLSNGKFLRPSVAGQMSFEFVLKTPLTEPVTVVHFDTYDAFVRLTKEEVTSSIDV